MSFNLDQLARRIDLAVDKIGLNLNDQCVLTEAASGPFAATSVISAVAGARQVFAVARDTRWGTVSDIKRMIYSLSITLVLVQKLK